MWCPSVVLSLCLLTFKWGIMAQDSGFRNRAIKHSLKTRQLILGYRGSTKIHKTRGTPPCTLRQPWVSVAWVMSNRDRYAHTCDMLIKQGVVMFFLAWNGHCIIPKKSSCYEMTDRHQWDGYLISSITVTLLGNTQILNTTRTKYQIL